jgi:hypothetical protein
MMTNTIVFSRYFQSLLWAFIAGVFPNLLIAQPSNGLWHNKTREIRYQPEGENFVCVNPTRKFNRALYGTNTGYRTEAGDLPEFALYMPGMGGNFKFGIIKGTTSKWLSASKVKAVYKPGSMVYEVKDDLFPNGTIHITVLSRADKDGFIIKVNSQNVADDVELVCLYGGATGRKFSRDGDIGADPESVFYLHKENCDDNDYELQKEGFSLKYGSGKIAPTASQKKQLLGVFPKGKYLIADAANQASPIKLWDNKIATAPVFAGKFNLKNQENYYFSIYNPEGTTPDSYESLKTVFHQAESARAQLAKRVVVKTPDDYINTLGGALAMAADAIWESPTYLHGAVAWRMRLNAWRGAYVADVLGWHDRAKLHFSSYANSQVLEPETGPIVSDTALNLARQKEVMGTAMFSSGYISRNPNANNRPHHYDMNLVFFDQIFNYFNWTGDVNFLKEIWPVLQRHMAWEKRNFDSDGDGLYDAYAAIWASDALQYSGGGVTHTSAYNYRANKEMARLAGILGKDAKPYQAEAAHILQAMQQKLWMPASGTFAEYKDLLGNQLLHTKPGLWTIYHAMDAHIPDNFQAWQLLKYIDHQIPHIPVKAKELEDKGYFTLSTTNWQPYTWSVNNVALAELLHTSLAYWQGGRNDHAFKLWKSSLIESMYLGASPGNFQQLSFYDAMRGELYRDFADPVAMAGRSLVEGLFGILPDALSGKLVIRPGLPKEWNTASLSIPDVSFDFKRTGNKEVYTIVPSFQKKLALTMQLKAYKSQIKSLKVNGLEVKWEAIETAIDIPEIKFTANTAPEYVVELEWAGNELEGMSFTDSYASGSKFNLKGNKSTLIAVNDAQEVLSSSVISGGAINTTLTPTTGQKTLFARLRQDDFSWWQAIDLNIREILIAQLDSKQEANKLIFDLHNFSETIKGNLILNAKVFKKEISLGGRASQKFEISDADLNPGSNSVRFIANGKVLLDTVLIYWDIKSADTNKFETINLAGDFNADLNKIFKTPYLSPRPNAVTLQIPTQGIGNWCYPLIDPEIDDSGLRKQAGTKNEVLFKNEIPFATPGILGTKNIVFTSKWDNYPDSIQISLKGKAKHAYFLMAGTTNHMQSRLQNAQVNINYTDGTSSVLKLNNPENWWPIEQDFVNDGYAFTTDAPIPPRLYLKSGNVMSTFADYKTIKGFSSYGIEGGAATILDLPLDPSKTLKNLTLKTIANEVIVGLMSVTLKR